MLKVLKSALCENPDEYSIRRIMFAIVFLANIILCFCGLKWPIHDNVVPIAISLITAAATAVTAGRFAENG